MPSQSPDFQVQPSRLFRTQQVREAGIVQLHVVNDLPGHPDEVLAQFNWLSGKISVSVNPCCSHSGIECEQLRNPKRVEVGHDGKRSWQFEVKKPDLSSLATITLHLTDDGRCQCEFIKDGPVIIKAIQTTRTGVVEVPAVDGAAYSR